MPKNLTFTKDVGGFKRGTGLLIIEVRNSNPNGDPDRESDPRQRPDRRGEISPVSYKRKLRDLVEWKGEVWSELANRLTLDNSRFGILEARGRDRKVIAGQLLLPAPKGISSKSCPLKSILLPMNLWGSNVSGFSQHSGSLPIAHAFTKNLVLAGILYPSMVMSSMDSLGTSTGAGGCNRKISLTTAFM